MGIVYEAEQLGAREFVKRVAIKVIRQNYADQKQFIENFIGEAKLVADLIHTNLVQTYHLGETNGLYFIAMELIRGVTLEQFAQACRSDEQAGRRLDFLTQEMFREANTIASKANNAKVSQHVVEIKVGIDRLKEQVQNIE